jgi:hypothetical protein
MGQGARIAEAIEDGDMAHADRRAKSRWIIDGLLEFLQDAGLPLSRGYVRDNVRVLPSEQISDEEQPGDAEPLDVRSIVKDQVG